MPREMQGRSAIETALERTGELLAAKQLVYRMVLVGGAAMNLLGYVARATTDVDVLAFASDDGRLRPPDEPLPEPVRQAAATVARGMRLDADWLNAGPAAQWRTGLPPGLADRVHWRHFGGLIVGLADRRDLIFLKLYAAADDVGPRSVHFQDLLALAPDDEELDAAAAWVCGQDPTPTFAETVSRVVAAARRPHDRTL